MDLVVAIEESSTWKWNDLVADFVTIGWSQ